MASQNVSAALAGRPAIPRRWPPEASILLVLVGIAVIFEILGWLVIGQSFLFNRQRLLVMILQGPSSASLLWASPR